MADKNKILSEGLKFTVDNSLYPRAATVSFPRFTEQYGISCSGIKLCDSLDTNVYSGNGITMQQFASFCQTGRFEVGKTIVMVDSGDALSQFQNGLDLRCKDILGGSDYSVSQLILDPYQKQSGQVIIKQPFFFDKNHYLRFTINASTKVSFIFYPYKTKNI